MGGVTTPSLLEVLVVVSLLPSDNALLSLRLPSYMSYKPLLERFGLPRHGVWMPKRL